MPVTQTSDVHWDQEAWDLMTYYSFRPQLFFDGLATMKSTMQDKPGHTVNFTFTPDLDPQVDPLPELTDVDATTLSSDTVQVTIAEYGANVTSTALLRGTSFIPVDPVKANVIGFNAGITHDTLARDVLSAGDNLWTNTQADGYIGSNDVRRIVASLRTANVPDFGGFYAGFVHPDQAVDLREQTGGANWRDPHIYSAPENIWNGEIGAFEGVRFVESPRVIHVDNGAASDDDYSALFLGQQALAKAFSKSVSSPSPSVVVAPVTDKLRRFVGVGWYWLGGYGVFRQEALWRLETTSSVGEAA